MKYLAVIFCVFVLVFAACQRTEQASAPQAPPQDAAPADKSASPPAPLTTDKTAPGRDVPVTAGRPEEAPGPAVRPADIPAQPVQEVKTALSKPVPPPPAVQDRIVVATFSTPRQGAPPGWTVDVKKGTLGMSIVKDGETGALRLVSNSSSFGIKKEAKINVRDYPFLNWKWKAVRIPAGGDVRDADTDDQALQLYLAFPAVGWPAALNSPVIGYIWDCESPRGYTGRSMQTGGGKLRYVTLRNKTDKLGEWQVEKRNVYEDYKRLFKDIRNGEPEGMTQGLQIHINSQHTGTEAEGLIGEIYFTRN